MKECKVCGQKTEIVFNIQFKATPICESCAVSICLQQVVWYSKQDGGPKMSDYIGDDKS